MTCETKTVVERELHKWHGAGNDFLIDLGGVPQWWTPERTRALCDRSRGVGADGLIVGEVGERVTMVLYNADGSRAETSGNGVRCLAAAVSRSRGQRQVVDSVVSITTDAGEKSVELTLDDTRGVATVDMGVVTFADPPAGAVALAYVGNPHVVVRDDESWTVTRRAEIAQTMSAAVGGANVEFLRYRDRGHLTLSVYERGVGWTMACGTGSCAVAAAARRAGDVDDEVTVVNPGGELRVSFRGEEVFLGGPVQFVATVYWCST